MPDGARVPPHHVQAEESLLGAMMLSKSAIHQALDRVGTNDFYKPAHRPIFDACRRLHLDGQPVDPVTVADELRRSKELDWVGGMSELVALQSGTPATSSAGHYADIIVNHALLRRLIHIGDAILESAYGFHDAAEIIDIVKADLAAVNLPSGALPQGLTTVDEFMAQDFSVTAPWIIPGLFRPLWRMMLVAEEGAGKTLLSQQLALCASLGVHPFTLEPIEPQTTLVIDGENPGERIYEGFKMIQQGLPSKDGSASAWLWHEPGGMDLRRRAWAAQFEAVLEHVRPKLVCFCPLYKLYSHTAKESDEIAAREVMVVLDDLRTRYQFALLIEHHAPKEQNGFRKLIPYGTVLWQRWCEMGRALVRADENEDPDKAINFKLEQNGRAGDRIKNEWPRGLFKSTNGLPWAARWEDKVSSRPDWRNILGDHDPYI